MVISLGLMASQVIDFIKQVLSFFFSQQLLCIINAEYNSYSRNREGNNHLGMLLDTLGLLGDGDRINRTTMAKKSLAVQCVLW